MGQDAERCAVCGLRFRMEDAIGTIRDRLVHARCLPKTPRVPDGLDPDENEPDEDDDLPQKKR